MSTVQQEVDEFEQLERQLLEASHISDASGLLFSSAQLRQSTERQEQTRQSYQRYGPPAAAPQEDSPDYSDDASASDYGDDDEKEIDGYRGASAVLHKHNSVGGIEHRQSPEPGFDVYRGGRMDEAEDEEEVSLRHLRKSWTGIPSGNVRGSQGMPRVDDSRSWGDVTAPPAGAGVYHVCTLHAWLRVLTLLSEQLRQSHRMTKMTTKDICNAPTDGPTLQ